MYWTAEIQTALDADWADTVRKRREAGMTADTPYERLMHEGTAMWKNHLTGEQKKEIREAYRMTRPGHWLND